MHKDQQRIQHIGSETGSNILHAVERGICDVSGLVLGEHQKILGCSSKYPFFTLGELFRTVKDIFRNEANLPYLWQLAYPRLHPEQNPSLPSLPVYTAPFWESRVLMLKCADEVPTSLCSEHSVPHGFRRVCNKYDERGRQNTANLVRRNQLTPSMETEAVRTYYSIADKEFIQTSGPHCQSHSLLRLCTH